MTEAKKSKTKTRPQPATEEGEVLDGASEQTLEEVLQAVPEPMPAVDPTAELRAEVAQLKDQYLRAHAEMENIRRRSEQEIANNRKFALQDFAKAMLPVADNLNRALAAVPAEAREKDEAAQNLILGIELTERELLTALERFGVKPIEAENRPFDPNLHQAMMQVDDANRPEGTVVQVVQGGFTMHNRLLRPAMVSVSTGGPKVTKTDAESAGSNLDESA